MRYIFCSFFLSLELEIFFYYSGWFENWFYIYPYQIKHRVDGLSHSVDGLGVFFWFWLLLILVFSWCLIRFFLITWLSRVSIMLICVVIFFRSTCLNVNAIVAHVCRGMCWKYQCSATRGLVSIDPYYASYFQSLPWRSLQLLVIERIVLVVVRFVCITVFCRRNTLLSKSSLQGRLRSTENFLSWLCCWSDSFIGMLI